MMKIWAERLRQGESLEVEFKVRCPKLTRLARTFSAFANSAGGTVFFGVDDTGEPVGLQHLNGTRDLVEQVAGFYCRPPVEIHNHDWEPLRGIRVLVVEIEEAQEKPVYALDPALPGEAWPFFRSESENLPLDKKSIKTMRRIPSDSLEDRYDDLSRLERQIIENLAGNPRQTLGRIARSINISSQRAKKQLVTLERNGWVHSFLNGNKREFSLAVPWKGRA